MKRKILSLILVFAMTVSLFTVGTGAVEPTYGDTAGHWAEDSIERWSAYGIIQGSNGQFDPNGQLTCAQLATILAKLLKLPAAKDAGFTDNTADAWYYDAINRCAAAGILNGNGDGTVTPEAPITRERAMVMLARALGIEPLRDPDLTKYADAAQVSAYAQGYVAALIEAGIVGGVTADELAPQDNINRASTVTILDRAISTYADQAGATVKADGGLVLVVADDVTVTGDVDKLLVPADNVEVTVSGSKNIDDITVTGDNSKVILKNSTANDVTLDGKNAELETKGGSKVENVSVTDDAKGATVNAGSGTTIKNVDNSAADTTVTGSGTVKNVASDTDITVETKNTNVENSGGEKITVTDAKGKDSTVSATGSGSSTVVNKETASSGNSGGSYTPPHTHSYVYSTNWDTTPLVSTKSCSCGASEAVENVYYIADDTQLAAFRDKVNAGNTFEGKTIELMADITVNDWTPIGQKESETNRFKGTFDGNEKTITVNGIASNLDSAFGGYAAFFGGITNATIKNLTVAGSISGADVAGIVSRADGGVIENCHNKANIEGTKKAAGIAVINKAGQLTIKNCTNEGSISSTNDRAGGIINLIQSANTSVENCSNSGSVTSNATATYGAGGIVGWAAADGFEIRSCTNTGAVSGKGAAGGILGGTGNTGTVSNCTNSTTVTLSAAAGNSSEHADFGGIVGYVKNNGEMLTASSNANTGILSGDATSRFIAENVTLSDDSYPQLRICKGAEVEITAGNLANIIYNYGTLTVKTQIGASGATGTNTQFHNYGTATLNCTMEAGSIHSHEGATTIFDGGTYHFTCVENMRNGLKFVSGTFNDLRKDNGQTQWTNDEFNACVASGSTASKEGHVWTVTVKNAG